MTDGASSAASRLHELIAADRVLTDAARCAAYEVDGMRPSAVLQPESAAEIAEILRFAAAENLAVIPMGGRTKLAIGMPPKRFDLALDLSRMNRVLAYDPRDLTCGVEAGVLFADLDRQLASERQFLPLAPAFADRATCGGIVAAGADSPLRHAYGSVRDYLLGVEFVTGDAVASKSGGRVVKNVTGYDLHKLLIGSLGTLAVITRLNFRTFPLPPEQQTFVASFANAESASAWCAAIAKSPLQPKLVEVLDPGTAKLFAAQGPRPLGPGLKLDRWSAVVMASGQRAVVERHAHDLEKLAREKNAAAFSALDKSEESALLRCISEFPSQVLETFPSAAIFRIAVLPSAIPDLLRQFTTALQRFDMNCAILVRASGVVYVALLPAAPDAQSAASASLAQACRELMDLGVALGVRPIIEWCPPAVKHELAAAGKSIWPPAGTEQVLAERLKKVFDPHGVLAPGRFQGGI
ncbi:MAG TPA: FAD-binding oxidoreductase [Candidatus Acidoferrales bacterium]